MENPSKWGKVRRRIHHAIEKYEFDRHQGILGERSLVSTIYEELRLAGYVVGDEPEERQQSTA